MSVKPGAIVAAVSLSLLSTGVSCSGKVTAQDSKTVETIVVATGTVAVVSAFEAGIAKPRSGGKWGLGGTLDGKPFASHVGELVIDAGDSSRTVYLCRRVWGEHAFGDLEGKELLEKLEAVSRASWTAASMHVEHCVDEEPGMTLLIARCRIDPQTSFDEWRRITIKPGPQGITSSFQPGSPSDTCDQIIKKHPASGSALEN